MNFCKRNGLVDGELDDAPELDWVNNEILRLETVLLARDSDAEFDASARQLGIYTDDDMLWAQGLIAEDQVRQESDDEESFFPAPSLPLCSASHGERQRLAELEP
jgi:hypothetical protein